MNALENVKGWLIDLDGTLFVGDSLLPGAGEFINNLRSQNRTFRIVSNSTVSSRIQIADKLHNLGIEVVEKEVFTVCFRDSGTPSDFWRSKVFPGCCGEPCR